MPPNARGGEGRSAAADPIPGTRPAWADRLDAAFVGDVHLEAMVEREPVLVDEGPFAVDPQWAASLTRQRRRLAAPGKYNETQAVLSGPIATAGNTVKLPYRRLEYALRCAVKEHGVTPYALSASVLPVCPVRRELYVQLRSAHTDVYPHRLHTFSGAFRPRQPSPNEPDDGDSLRTTARRELFEETGLWLEEMRAPRLMVDRELETGAIEAVWLGLTLDETQAASMQGSEEGRVYTVAFDDLPGLLADRRRWVPCARFHVLAWLAEGAPTPDSATLRFAGESGPALFDRALAHVVW